MTVRADQDWRFARPVWWKGVNDNVFNPIRVVTRRAVVFEPDLRWLPGHFLEHFL